jgi:hypothetical protein
MVGKLDIEKRRYRKQYAFLNEMRKSVDGGRVSVRPTGLDCPRAQSVTLPLQHSAPNRLVPEH